MKVRRVQYNIHYGHVLTFRNDYKKIISPYIALPNVQYAIENINTMNESGRLVFQDLNSIIQCRKDGITLVVEGDLKDAMAEHGAIHEFFAMYESITKLECFSKTLRHDILVNSVDTTRTLESTEYIKVNPFNNLIDFAVTYHFEYKKYDVHFSIGNFVQSDIQKFDLTPFKSTHNADLKEAKIGITTESRVAAKETTPDFFKFKSICDVVERNLKLF